MTFEISRLGQLHQQKTNQEMTSQDGTDGVLPQCEGICTLLDLPVEIRLVILELAIGYDGVIDPSYHKRILTQRRRAYTPTKACTQILATCRKTRDEGRGLLYKNNRLIVPAGRVNDEQGFWTCISPEDRYNVREIDIMLDIEDVSTDTLIGSHYCFDAHT